MEFFKSRQGYADQADKAPYKLVDMKHCRSTPQFNQSLSGVDTCRVDNIPYREILKLDSSRLPNKCKITKKASRAKNNIYSGDTLFSEIPN